jgi:hypothetical protein
VHRRTVVAFAANLNAGRLGQVVKDRGRLAFGELRAIKINAHRDTPIGGASERLQDRPVIQDVGRHVDFALCGVYQCRIHMLEVFGGRVMDCRIGAPWHAEGEDHGGQNWAFHFAFQVRFMSRTQVR